VAAAFCILQALRPLSDAMGHGGVPGDERRTVRSFSSTWINVPGADIP